MDRDKTIEIIDAFYDDLDKHGRKMKKKPDEEAIHHFRVSFKKLRAFLRMTIIKQPVGLSVKFLASLKKTYHFAGKIRDLQMLQNRIKEDVSKGNKKPKEFIDLLQIEVKKLGLKISKNFSRQLLISSKKETNALFPEDFSFDDPEAYAKEKWETIFSIITSRMYSDENIHIIRKHLKDLFYNLHIPELQDEFSTNKLLLPGKDKTYYQLLLDELGIFQDYRIFLELLEGYRFNTLQVYEKHLLETFKKNWILEKKRYKDLLILQLENEIYTLNNY